MYDDSAPVFNDMIEESWSGSWDCTNGHSHTVTIGRSGALIMAEQDGTHGFSQAGSDADHAHEIFVKLVDHTAGRIAEVAATEAMAKVRYVSEIHAWQ